MRRIWEQAREGGNDISRIDAPAPAKEAIGSAGVGGCKVDGIGAAVASQHSAGEPKGIRFCAGESLGDGRRL